MDSPNISASPVQIETPQSTRLILTEINRDNVSISHFTPRENEINLSIPYTPVGDEANVYRYYCPLCMLYFKKILKSQCCGNYICVQCTVDYLNSKGINKIRDIETAVKTNKALLDNIACPNCMTNGFTPLEVSYSDSVRDYSRSFCAEISVHRSYYDSSPVRAGETFEDLKRKMIPYATNKPNLITTQSLTLETRQLSGNQSTFSSPSRPMIDTGSLGESGFYFVVFHEYCFKSKFITHLYVLQLS